MVRSERRFVGFVKLKSQLTLQHTLTCLGTARDQITRHSCTSLLYSFCSVLKCQLKTNKPTVKLSNASHYRDSLSTLVAPIKGLYDDLTFVLGEDLDFKTPSPKFIMFIRLLQ